MTELCKENDTDGVGRHDDDDDDGDGDGDDDGDDDDAIDDGDLDPHLREKTKNQPCDSVADAWKILLLNKPLLVVLNTKTVLLIYCLATKYCSPTNNKISNSCLF